MVNVSTFFVSLLALAAGAAAFKDPQPPVAHHERRGPQADPQPPAPHTSRDFVEARELEHTNAKRLAAGQPLLPPTRRSEFVPRGGYNAQPSASPRPGRKLTGYIQISNAKNGEFIGYVGKQYALYGEFGPVQKMKKQGLKVEINGIKNGKSGPHQILGKNGDTVYPWVGVVTGYANSNDYLSAGSYNYVYIGGTKQTPVGSTPQNVGSAFNAATGQHELAESGVWYFNTNNRKITLGYVNPDGSVANNAKICLYKADNTLFAVGDLNVFKNRFGNCVAVTLTLVDD